MSYTKFLELDKDIDELYDNEKYEEALELFDEGLKSLPEKEIQENFFSLMWVKSVLYTMCDKYDECMETIEHVIEQGYSFPIHFERFKPLKEKKGYNDLKVKNDKLLEELRLKTKPQYVVHLPENYDPHKKYPLFIALHGDGISNIQEFSGYWQPNIFIKNNIILAYVQSSQVICHNGHGWLRDLETARKDIKDCYELISKEYLLDEKNILIGGFSGGAIASIDFTLSDVLPIKGFIALCPEQKTEAFTKENVELAVEKGIKGVLMEGELVLPMHEETEMMKMFDEVGLSYEYYINKETGHRAPNDFDNKLKKALNFILT